MNSEYASSIRGNSMVRTLSFLKFYGKGGKDMKPQRAQRKVKINEINQ
jgi:hypothetical protein